MSSFLSAIDLYSENQFWRVRGEKEISNACGGISSLLVLLTVLALLVIKLREAVSLDQTSVSFNIQSSLESVSLEMLTSSTNPMVRPVMMGLSFPSGTIGNYTSKVSYNNGSTFEPILMEQCTKSHFSLIQNFEDLTYQFNLSSTLCLPLNQSYTFGGNRFSAPVRSQNEKSLWFEISCGGNCSIGDSIDFFTMSSAANPGDPKASWSASLYRKRMVTSSSEQRFYADLIDTYIIKEVTMIPFQKKETVTEGLVLNKIFDSEIYTSPVSPGNLKVIIGSSTQVVTYTQTFITFLDVFAYVGGVYATILVVFIFVPPYSDFYYQIGIGKKFLKKKQEMKMGFLTFTKDFLASLLKFCGVSTEWQGVEVRNNIRQCVSKMLDVVYLQRRINFIEKTLTVLFERHQLKGIHLLQRFTQQEIEHSFKNQKLRENLIKFCKKKKEKKKRGKALSQISEKLKEKSQNRENEQKPKSEGKFLNNQEQKHTGSRILKTNEQLKQSQFEEASNISNILYIDESEDDSEIQNEIQQQMSHQLQNDLKLLISEAENKTDQRSRVIFQRIDKKVQQMLKISVKEQQGRDHRMLMFSLFES